MVSNILSTTSVSRDEADGDSPVFLLCDDVFDFRRDDVRPWVERDLDERSDI